MSTKASKVAPLKFELFGDDWTVRYVPLYGNDHALTCHPDDPEHPYTIFIQNNPLPTAEQEIDWIIHEMQHASYRHIDEDSVEKSAAATASLLWRRGFRRID